MTFIRNCWYVGCWSSELADGGLFPSTIIGEPVMLYRAADGSAVGMEDRCVHRLAPLSLGERDGDAIRCMYHGFKFDRSGVCIEVPGQTTIPRSACVRTFPVAEKGGWVWVWMGDPEKADVDLIPGAIGPGDKGWLTDYSNIDYDADYQLINDNLTDFSHLSYVHRNSFGASGSFAEERPTVIRLDRGIRVQRWLRGEVIKAGSSGTPLDRWQTYDYLAPGILLLNVIAYPEGTADTCGNKAPPQDMPKGREMFNSQALTPISEQKTRYFFSTNFNEAPGNEIALKAIMAATFMAFEEDKKMIEGQQKIINADPSRKELLFGHDTGPVQMRRVIQDLIKAETTEFAGQAA